MGFKSWITGMAKKEINNMFQEYQEEKKQEALDTVAEPIISDSMGKVTGAIG